MWIQQNMSAECIWAAVTGCNLWVTRQLSLWCVATARPALGSPSQMEWAAGPCTPRGTPAPLVPGVGDMLPEELTRHLLWSCLPFPVLMSWKQRRCEHPGDRSSKLADNPRQSLSRPGTRQVTRRGRQSHRRLPPSSSYSFHGLLPPAKSEAE